jgi:aminopeptidase N
MHLLAILLSAVAAQEPTPLPAADLRAAYDVHGYRLDLRVDVERRVISGTVAVDLEVTEAGLATLQLDVGPELVVERVRASNDPLSADQALRGKTLYFKREDDRLNCQLPRASRKSQRMTLLVTYSGSPGMLGQWKGVHWGTQGESGPLFDLSVQNTGASHWWPCKSSFDHPEDRPERVIVNLTIPDGLVGVSNGRLAGRTDADPGWVTWHWRHDYPIDTYGVCVSVGEYEFVAREIELPELEGPVPFVYCVEPALLERAEVQFARIPEILAVYTRAFGPWPFPGSKVGVVQSAYPSVDHSTLVGYGSSYPAWLEAQGLDDPYGHLNRGYDYLLVHQLAHEWWGNSVAAETWNDYWLHEGFATYAESLWLEHLGGRERSDSFFTDLAGRIGKTSRLSRPGSLSAREAFSRVLHFKGAWVLHTLRHYVDDDEVWWGVLRRFQREYRHATATTADLRRVLEAETGDDWSCFFDEWVYGQGYPRLDGVVHVHAKSIEIDVENSTAQERCFHVPLDLEWLEDGERVTHRVSLLPGENRIALPLSSRPTEVRVLNLPRLLGRHSVAVSKD